MVGAVLFGVLCSLFGVRDLDTGVVLGATFTLRAVLDSIGADDGTGDGFGIADLEWKMYAFIKGYSIDPNWRASYVQCQKYRLLASRITNGSWNSRSWHHALCGCRWSCATATRLLEQFLFVVLAHQLPLDLQSLESIALDLLLLRFLCIFLLLFEAAACRRYRNIR